MNEKSNEYVNWFKTKLDSFDLLRSIELERYNESEFCDYYKTSYSTRLMQINQVQELSRLLNSSFHCNQMQWLVQAQFTGSAELPSVWIHH